jgi:hypothetical protein
VKKTEVIDWKEFMSGTYRRPTTLQAIAQHVERNKTAYRIGAAVVVLFLASDVSALASPLDDRASALYHDKLLGFGKWALIVRGGWGTIHKTMQEDFDGAKKHFISYLTIYLILLAFPWAMKEMDGIFV